MQDQQYRKKRFEIEDVGKGDYENRWHLEMMMFDLKKWLRFGNLIWIRLNNAWWLSLLPGAVLFDVLALKCPHVVKRHRKHPLLTSALLAVLFWLTLVNMMVWFGIAIRWLPQIWSGATLWVSRVCANAWVRGKSLPEKT